MNKRTQQHVDQNLRHGAHNYSPFPVVLSSGEGVWVFDIEGNHYIDCLGAYSAASHGHCHPRIVRVAREQAGLLTIVGGCFLNEEIGPFRQELATLCGKNKVLNKNTGAEAVEAAIKLARKWGYSTAKGVHRDEAEIIAFDGNFHGRTYGALSLSATKEYREGFGPFMPGVKWANFGDLGSVDMVMNNNTVAVIVEPIQAEGGILVPPYGFLKDLRKLCTDRNVLLIADEIQVGLGRTGEMFCSDHEGVVPDMYVLGKALGAGYPVSAVVANDEIMQVMNPGDDGSTFAGNPFACAIGREALRIIVEDRLAERAKEMGVYFRERLIAIRSPHVKEVRGKGLLIGVEIKRESGTASAFSHKLVEAGVLVKEAHDTTLRFAPPLIITREEIDWAMERIEPVLMQSL
ncbi:MAG: ornithine--oxo-acid transaminase [Candidatus Liptonbacteria bacterium]|nr:ornithine--oxo-acid transaminase [Candidatus Liptonbacteria bacterium]